MGIAFSRVPTETSEVDIVHSDRQIMAGMYNGSEGNVSDVNDEEFHETSEELGTRTREEEMIEFNKELAIKREKRREVLTRHREEKENLKRSLDLERKAKGAVMDENKKLKELLKEHNVTFNVDTSNEEDCFDIKTTIKQMQDEFESLKENNNRLRRDLAESNLSVQMANADIANLNYQNVESMRQISALKEVITVSKTMINLREQQLNELKEKLSQIEKSLADRETNLLSTDLRQEYERQLQNIRTLRELYEERARLAEVTRLNLLRELEEQKALSLTEGKKCKELTNKVEELEEKVKLLTETVQNKNDQINSSQDETKGLKAEMNTVNKLFSQVLLGYKSTQNWDQLVHRLEENHGILTHMVERDDGSESSSALPKLLLELVSQVDEGNKENEKNGKKNDEDSEKTDGDNHSGTQNVSAEEIVQNLPKVWKVLMELLSHQNSAETNTTEKIATCYKTVETASGSVLVPSVSQTYIRLKDLIMEKLALIKEVNKMKQLNSHLESRLGEQEGRLCLVTSELSKTWHVVGRLRRHHHQLHTHEKILKYELQQKRKLLNELKEELAYCREKWEKAREKNSQSERDYRKLRAEFSSRKVKANSPIFNNSGESGYSDEKQSDDSSDSNDESEYNNEIPLRHKNIFKASFDNILDSSADMNLTAEREDPISDLLDVADLPLDSHELEEGVERPGTSSAHLEVEDISMSDSCHSNLRSDKNCEETEDEVGDIAIDSYVTDVSADNSSGINEPKTIQYDSGIDRVSDNAPKITNKYLDQSDIVHPISSLDNIDHENEAVNRSNGINCLKKESALLLNITQNTAVETKVCFNQLDQDLNQPGTSENKGKLTITQTLVPQKNSCSTVVIDTKQILENIKRQNERLARKDERLNNLERGCNDVVECITNTLSISKDIETKLVTIHASRNNDTNIVHYENSNDSAKIMAVSNDTDISDEPSTSRDDVDHEARFAARDLRLKRLEEQTKSLVSKVNDTTRKGVKIHYKLEELHNIYGSENSRASTPAEENDNENDDDDDNNSSTK